MTQIFEGDYAYSTLERDTLSDSGERINAGDTFFWNQDANSILTLNEGEVEILGLRDFSTAERKKLAKSGAAMSDGSFPIASCQDAMNARHAIGRAPAGKRPAVRAHIKTREKALGCNNGPLS